MAFPIGLWVDDLMVGEFVTTDSYKDRKPRDTTVGQLLKLDRDRLADGRWQLTLGVRQTGSAVEPRAVGQLYVQRAESSLVAALPRFVTDDESFAVVEAFDFEQCRRTTRLIERCRTTQHETLAAELLNFRESCLEMIAAAADLLVQQQGIGRLPRRENLLD